MNLTKLMLEKVKKRAIDNIALLTFNNVSTYDKKIANEWQSNFFNLDSIELEELINAVYKQQCESISEATNRCIDFIKIPALGSIRLNRTRLEILNLKDEKGLNVDESEIDEIKRKHFEQILALKRNSTVNVNININEKKT